MYCYKKHGLTIELWEDESLDKTRLNPYCDGQFEASDLEEAYHKITTWFEGCKVVIL